MRAGAVMILAAAMTMMNITGNIMTGAGVAAGIGITDTIATILTTITFKRKIYYLPFKKYYYHYDVYPERIYYYDIEKDIRSSNANYLPISSIAHMASQGLPDDVIIEEIKKTNSAYALSSDIIIYLRQNNVSDTVIDYMLETGRK